MTNKILESKKCLRWPQTMNIIVFLKNGQFDILHKITYDISEPHWPLTLEFVALIDFFWYFGSTGRWCLIEKVANHNQGSQMCWANIFFSLFTKIPPQIYLIAPFSPTTFIPKATFCWKTAQIKHKGNSK